MAEQDQDKTEQATPFKLREARKRGQVAKSMELNSFILLLLVLILSFFMGDELLQDFLALNAKIIAMSADFSFYEGPVLLLYETVLNAVFSAFWFVVAAIMLSAILSNLVQIGPVFSVHALKPDIQRLNPVSGFKRVFSVRMLFDFIKTIVKILILSTIVYFSIRSGLPSFIKLIDVNAKSYGALLLGHANSLALKLVAALFFISIIDIAFTRRDYQKKMMMSRRELKDEVKRREGDPRIKMKLRELQREAAKRSASLQKVPDSDIMITNPTHISVAISYDKEQSNAPVVNAKGSGDLAEKMKTIARKNNIPIFEDKKLARALFKKVAIDGVVPEEFFRKIAKLLVISYRIKKQVVSS